MSTALSLSTNCQNHLVDRIYRRTNQVATYATPKLLPPEATALIRYRDDILHRRVLDLGCGAGRLAVYLNPLVAGYTGFDISPYMVQHCRQRFPDLSFLQGDMRDLTGFGDESFETIVAVSNLFDAVSHDDRMNVLREVRRILAPGGLLFFSSHNRNYAHAGQGPSLAWTKNPVSQLRNLMDYCEAARNHRRLKCQQRQEEHYALFNDSGCNYASLHYYIRRQVQWKQLLMLGYQPLECLDSHGRSLHEADDDADFPSIHYIARKPLQHFAATRLPT